MTALLDDQFSWEGVTMGAFTPYRVRSHTGIRGPGVYQSNDTPKLAANGSFPGVDTVTGRVIDLIVTIVTTAGSAYETALEALEAAMAPLPSSTSSFHYKMRSQAEQKIEARPRKCDLIIVPTYRLGWTDAIGLEWVCPDATWVPA
jgi:hypothetical protein